MHYVIEEDLMVIGQERILPTRDFTPHKAAKIKTNLTLAQQHSGPLFSGPLNVSIDFFFPYTKFTRNKHFYISKPNIATMCRFIIDAGIGAVLKDDFNISCLTCKKVYDEKSRIEITIVNAS